MISILDTGAIAAYKGAIRCRILKVRTTLIRGRVRSALVNFGGGLPHMWVAPADLTVLRGETHITPTR